MILNGREINNGTIRTDIHCRGCNKCIAVCPAFGANAAVFEGGRNRVYVDRSVCIACGKCLDACPHGARVLHDDTARFFTDLEALRSGQRKRPISVVVDSAFEINYPEKYMNILGWLKALGVQNIYSTAEGADIMVWAYICCLEQSGRRPMIASYCPAVVEYAERYHPEVLEALMPVMSPLMCTSVYLRKYLNMETDIAFIGPCSARESEIAKPENRSYVQYNISISGLMEAAADINHELYSPVHFDSHNGLGAYISTCGGLKENMEYYLGADLEHFVGYPSGNRSMFSFVDNKSDADFQPVLTDVCCCDRGCVSGPAAGRLQLHGDHARMARIKAEQSAPGTLPAERLSALNARFKSLNLNDFLTGFSDRSAESAEVRKAELEEAFQKLIKNTREEKSVDCTACGFSSCRKMAEAVALGLNHEQNCLSYTRKLLSIERSQNEIHKRRIEQADQAAPSGGISGVDPLTGVATRYGFERYMENALKRSRSTGSSGYVFSIDLDDFMTINESYGHSFGNAMLVEFTRFLKENLGGLCEIFRADGDEFMLVAEGVDAQTANYISESIVTRGQNMWKIMGARIYCTVSVGVVSFPGLADSVSNIVKSVELAMHAAKEQGKNRSVSYVPEMDRNTQGQTQMLRLMRDAVVNDFDRFDVYYQPWVTCEGDVVGAEALLRWRDEKGKLVHPSEFIDIAELSGLIVTLDEFVLKRAVEKVKEISAINPGFMMSVNFSSRQFSRPDVCRSTLEIIDAVGDLRGNIILEITETPEVENLERYREAFKTFSAAGIKVALDDFGTGYSSLSYLNGLQIDLVKFNRSFIRSVETDRHVKYLFTTTVELMHKMGRRVCVKGVESRDQLDFCEGVGADIVQGFLFFNPMPGTQLMQLVKIS